jgi:hypothetical protein
VTLSANTLSTPIKIEELKESHSSEKLYKYKRKKPQGETTTLEENPLKIKGTSKTKTPVEQLLYATLIELESSKIEAMKWKRME